MDRDIILSGTADSGRNKPGSKILIVEDHPDWGEVLQAMFKSRHEVEIYPSDTRGSWGKNIPDVVILGVTLPDSDKCRLFEDLRSNQETMLVPIVFLVREEAKSEKIKSLPLGAKDCVIEPDYIKIRRCVKQALCSRWRNISGRIR